MRLFNRATPEIRRVEEREDIDNRPDLLRSGQKPTTVKRGFSRQVAKPIISILIRVRLNKVDRSRKSDPAFSLKKPLSPPAEGLAP